MPAPRQIEIWFFIGALLFLYGVLITGAGIYHLFHPPVRQIALGELHADVWWGMLLLALGAFYSTRFWPWRRQAPPEE
ncbi:MAG TPA: hypothetical protein VMM80_11680 [Bacteroidota bacterium]|nr:hypothetical protein [Bacteroidota bacterium]